MFKKSIVIFLIVLFALSLSIVTMAAGKTELRVSWWGSETRHRATLEAIDLYEQLNPDVTIKAEYSGWDGYRNKLFSQIMAGNAPDVFTTIMEWYPDLIAADGLADLTGMIDVSGHNPKYVDACSYNGKMYGVNLSLNSMVLYQNRTILAKYDIEPLKSPYTWEDMAAKFKEVYEKSNGNVYGSADSTVMKNSLGFDLVKYYGYSKLGATEPFPYNNDKFTVNEEQIKSYFQYFDSLRKNNAFAPTDLSAMNDDSANSLLVQGLVAFDFGWAGTLGRYQDQTTDDIQPLPLPVGKNDAVGDVARPGLIFSLANNSKNKEEAAKFIEWFTISPEAAKILKNCRGVLPTDVQRSALLNSDVKLSKTDEKVMSVIGEVQKRELKTSYAGPSKAVEVSQIILPEINQKIGFGKITIDQAVKEFMDAIE